MMIDARPFLRQQKGPEPGRVHPLNYGDNVIGRDSEAEVSVDIVGISRRHANVRVNVNGVVVQDLGSKNGVLVDGKKITGPAVLGHGACLSLGEVSFEVHHPGAQVSAALARVGETTVSRLDWEGSRERDAKAALLLRWPLLATVIFGLIVAALLLSGGSI
ncbi:MAG TPA: FHA domain-containing protein [Nannocystis exedens]|nr:FHA domain-containing protein [Nannocystis exedens]